MSVGRILFGYYRVPDSASEPIDFTVNLEGEELRSAKRCPLLSAFTCLLLNRLLCKFAAFLSLVL